MSRRRGLVSWLPVACLGLVAAVAPIGCGDRSAPRQSVTTLAGLRLAGAPVGGLTEADLLDRLRRLAPQHARRPIVLRWPGGQRSVIPAALGVALDPVATAAALLSVGHQGPWSARVLLRWRARRERLDLPWQLSVARARALRFFRLLALELDRDPAAPRLDLEGRRVVPGRAGARLDPPRALASTETALRSGRDVVALPLLRLAPLADPSLAGVDIRQVLGHFVTVYSQADVDRDRAHNLRLVARRLDAQVLPPGGRFSFNETVGPRTEEQGYRTAAVIEQGELVDGMAGGACQLSSTLFAAAFFAGLDLLSSRPHTIPSSYTRLGLDAAVAYPATDLRLGNPYPFPVVFHVRVNQGQVRVEILGRQRPWRRVVFRREVKQREPFPELEREDPTLPRAQRVLVQHGVPGFLVERQRLFFGAASAPVRSEKRVLHYPANPALVHVGVGAPLPVGAPSPAASPPATPYRADVEALTIEQ